jgi:hypothetical protein
VKVGAYCDMRNPPEWRQDRSRLYGFTLEIRQPAGGSTSTFVAGYRYPEYELFDANVSRRYTTTDRRVTDPSGVWMPGIASVAWVVVHVERSPA